MSGAVDARIELLGVDALAQVEAVSAAAFDPRYGEAWNKAQCLSVLSLPGYRLSGAWVGQGESAVLAGFLIDRTVAGETELLLIAVHPDYRRHGIASRLIDALVDLARSTGVARIFLEMRQDNPVRTLYEHYGFRDIALRTAYYRGNDGVMRNAVTMAMSVE